MIPSADNRPDASENGVGTTRRTPKLRPKLAIGGHDAPRATLGKTAGDRCAATFESGRVDPRLNCPTRAGRPTTRAFVAVSAENEGAADAARSKTDRAPWAGIVLVQFIVAIALAPPPTDQPSRAGQA